MSFFLYFGENKVLICFSYKKMWCQISSATFRMRASQDHFTHLCGVQQNEMFVSTLFEKSEPQPPVANRGPLENDLLKSCHGRSSELADKVWGMIFHPSHWWTGENTTTQWGWRCRWLWTHPSFSCHRWSFYLPELIKQSTFVKMQWMQNLHYSHHSFHASGL